LISIKGASISCCLVLLSCSNNIDQAMERPIHNENKKFQTEDYRKINLEGTHNTRELGGYITEEGKSLKWGVLYRSDKLSELSQADQDYLVALGIKNIVDFRSAQEKEEEPDKIPNGINYIELPIEADGAIRPRVEAILRGEDDTDPGDLLVNANKDFVLKYKEEYKRFLLALAEKNEPTLFHCTAGKDRAGYAAAITLLTVGVPVDVVIEDYLKTNIYAADFIENSLDKVELFGVQNDDVEKLRPLLGVEERFILAALKKIDEEFGSFQAFVSSPDGLNLDTDTINNLKSFLLE